MRYLYLALLACGLALAGSFAGVPPVWAEPKDRVISVPTEDEAMNAAMAKARASLDRFWAAKDSPKADEEGFALKVRIEDDGQSEHFWLTDVKRDGGKLSGSINNDPQWVGNVKMGQRYEFKEADVSDWMFMRKGRIVGNETLRVLLGHMPAAEAAQYKRMLENP